MQLPSNWFELSEKQTKFEKIFLIVLTNQLIYLLNVKTMREIFSNYVCFSKSPIFIIWKPTEKSLIGVASLLPTFLLSWNCHFWSYSTIDCIISFSNTLNYLINEYLFIRLQCWAHIDWLPKFATGLKCFNKHRSKSIWVTILSFCQSDSLMSESFWQRDRMVTHIFLDLCLIKHFSPVANFGNQSLDLVKVRSSTLKSNKWVLVD